MSLLDKPARCGARVHIALRFQAEGLPVELLATLPRNQKALVGLFTVKLGKKESAARIEEIADHILEELGGESEDITVNSFKRTRNDNLCVGVGCLKRCLAQAVGAVEGGDGEPWRGAKIWLRSRIFMDPGKWVLMRMNSPLGAPDGQIGRALPPAFGRPKSAIVVSDYVGADDEGHPVWIHGDVWYDNKDIAASQLKAWFEAAGLVGLQGWRTAGYGQFEVANFELRLPYIAPTEEHAYQEPCGCFVKVHL